MTVTLWTLRIVFPIWLPITVDKKNDTWEVLLGFYMKKLRLGTVTEIFFQP